jgi:type IV secretion system protein VirD4
MAGYGVRAYLIAQSLNQIEKAYGPANSILDNCHVRVTFATNDERTAKRVSDAIGTTTELRSQKNYTGHRLAPWLSHMMVSRQETQRALITPGEVMQLPADDEIVLVSGAPPVLAKKLRYYDDRNFTSRVLPAAPIRPGNGLGRGTDWDAAAPTEDGEPPTGAGPDGPELRHALEPELALDPADPELASDPEIEPDSDDLADPSPEDRRLDAIRRAVGLDRADPDVLPDF